MSGENLAMDNLARLNESQLRNYAEMAQAEIERLGQRNENLSRLQHGTYQTLEHARDRITVLEEALQDIAQTANMPENLTLNVIRFRALRALEAGPATSSGDGS